MEALIDGAKWFLVNYGLPTLILVLALALILYIVARNSGADTLKTVNSLAVQNNSLAVQNNQQLIQLQTDYREVIKLYIGLLKSSGDTNTTLGLSDEKLRNFMLLYDGDKADWIKERDGLKRELATAIKKLDAQSTEIADLKKQIEALLLRIESKDAEIVDLKNDKSSEKSTEAESETTD